jgi:hypothetical protein
MFCLDKFALDKDLEVFELNWVDSETCLISFLFLNVSKKLI